MPREGDSGSNTKIRGRRQPNQSTKPSDGPPPTRRASSTSSRDCSNKERKRKNQRINTNKVKEVERNRTDSSLDREYQAQAPKPKTTPIKHESLTPHQRALYKAELARIRRQPLTSDSSSLSGGEASDDRRLQESLVENKNARNKFEGKKKLKKSSTSRNQCKIEETLAALHLPESASIGEQRAKIIDELAAQETARQLEDEKASEESRKRAKREQDRYRESRQVSADLKTPEQKKKLREDSLDVLGRRRRRPD
jgi:hypothetical protein